MTSRPSSIHNHADVIARWETIGAFAADIGVPYVTAQVMKHRARIHSRHWDAVVEAAARRGWPDITHELLSRTSPKGRPHTPRRRAGEARAA